VLRGASLRVANSTFTAERVAALHPNIGAIASCPLALLPDTRTAPKAGSALSVDLGPRAVIVVARMAATERYKGHDELLDAWPRVLAHAPDARLVFVGDGDDKSRLQARAGALGIDSSVVFTGFVSESNLIAFYRKAAVFAMPSRGEGFGLVYLEAMTHRLPCIGALEDAAAEIIEDGRTGFLVHQSDRDGLSDRLVRLLTDEPLRHRMGGAGHCAVHHRFSYERFSRSMLSLIESTVAIPTPAWGGGAAL
jgi:phosphatidylinositol alpha-1,6-mannosyltransferase